MSEGFVADSSVAIAWALESQASAATEHLLNEVASGQPFFVPVLWSFEIANALLVLTRRRRIQPEQCVRARRALSRLTPIVDEEGSLFVWDEIGDLAAKYDLSVYDATYLEVAVRRNLPLASRDAPLNIAARREGVRTLL